MLRHGAHLTESAQVMGSRTFRAPNGEPLTLRNPLHRHRCLYHPKATNNCKGTVCGVSCTSTTYFCDFSVVVAWISRIPVATRYSCAVDIYAHIFNHLFKLWCFLFLVHS